ncbi:MAG: histidine--tRNA ligase [Limnochordia bacterium]|jgi:histidyl-tRNA synthetase
MANFSAPRGTRDLLPEETQKWQYMEEVIRRVCGQFAYQEIRTPIFEHTELFERGIGEATDIVEKEMYTFSDRGGRSLTLRPEGTAPVVRAYLENKLYGTAGPARLYYYGPMFRYERPQAGRYRQFHQLGIEAIGSQSPMVDAECIDLATSIFREMGLVDLHIQLNSIGCPQCRPNYREKLKELTKPHLEGLCSSCQSRWERNPMRILDCKEEGCQERLAGLPGMDEYLCSECADHLAELQSYLQALEIPYEMNPRLVRGFDYYTKTVFEVISSDIGAQAAIAGGGRYDGLVEECGGKPTPAVGFAAGLERILLALEAAGKKLPTLDQVDVFVAFLGSGTGPVALEIAQGLRKQGRRVEVEVQGRSLKAQLKRADRLGVQEVIIVGEGELERGEVTIRDMETGEQRQVPWRSLV